MSGFIWRSHMQLAGSDWPVCTVAADYHRTIALVDDYVKDWPAAERDAVMGGNAERLWRLAESVGAISCAPPEDDRV